MDFIASGLVEMVGGFASGLLLFGYSWWARAVLIGAWVSTHYLLRESAVWQDRNTDEVRTAQRHSDYAYRLAVDAPAAKEVRLFGLSDWVIERFTLAAPPPLRAAVEVDPLRERTLGAQRRDRARRERARRVVDRERRRRRPASASTARSCSSPRWSARR